MNLNLEMEDAMHVRIMQCLKVVSATLVVCLGLLTGEATNITAQSSGCPYSICIAGSDEIYDPDYCDATINEWQCEFIEDELCYTSDCPPGSGCQMCGHLCCPE